MLTHGCFPHFCILIGLEAHSNSSILVFVRRLWYARTVAKESAEKCTYGLFASKPPFFTRFFCSFFTKKIKYSVSFVGIVLMDDYTGRQIGNYRILRRLGTGSFATVYLAEHLYIEKLAAIKLLHISINAQSYREFQEEARINARLEHPHIIRLLDFGFYQQTPYLVMEYAPNGTLRQLYPKKSLMPPQQIINYVPQIAEALDYAHQQNVIHRDVKPENLLLNSRNELILSDFGIAILQQTQQSSAKGIAGTPLYMAPEQFRGSSLPASDQYALGIMVYEWLCGEPPFSGNAYALSYQHVEQPPRPLSIHVPGISPAIDNAVLRALAKNPAHRFSSVQDFAITLQQAIFAIQPSLRSAPIANQLHPKNTYAHVHLSSASAVPAYRQSTDENITQSGYQMSPLVKNQQGYTANMPTQPPSENFPVQAVSPSSSQQIVQNQNRQSLVRRVRSFWITGVLEQSLAGAALMELDIQEMPDAVANPWKQIVPTSTMSRISEQRKSILQFYNDAGADLLILGAPGSGKTTMLLTLARDLLTQAEQNGDRPVPVIFNLSTWSNNQPLAAWLVDELDSKYQVHRKLGQQLIKANLILPLLDGLDEVAIKERTACIETINRYRREPDSSPLVVCSRSADYLAQEARLLLNKAVLIQPLNMQQANNYLVQAGDPLHALRVALQSETALHELMRTPLLLRMLTLTYYGVQVPDVLGASTSSEQIPLVLERYVERMLTRGSDKESYSPQATKHWLAWLARQLQQHNQKIFHIERMQPDYLEEGPERQRYTRIVVGLIFSVLGIVLLSPSWVSTFVYYPAITQNNNFTLISSLTSLSVLVTALMLGWVNGVLYQRQAKVSGTSVRQKWGQRGQRFVRGIVNMLLIGLFFGVPFNFILRYVPIDVSKLHMSISLFADFSSLIESVESGLLLFLADWLLGIQTTEIRPAEIIAWSWGKFWRTFFKFLGIGLLYYLLICLLLLSLHFIGDSLLHILSTNQATEVLAVIALILVVILPVFGIPFFALLKGLTSGLSTSILDPRDIALPNQGIRRSARNSLLVGLGGLFFLIGIPALVAILFKWAFWSNSLGYIQLIVLIVLIMALRTGGTACIQHFVLRWLLWREGAIPRNYPHFLDYAAEHILLQKVGGGYMFVHRFLLEYFASLETPPSHDNINV
jgi:serine/threonine protein kinase